MPAYREPNHARSIVEIAITLGPLVALWLSTMATNFPIALVVAVLIWCVGVGPFSARAFADHVDRWLGRGVAILRPAPV